MSKQGNYVTVPTGNGSNPFKGVGDSLLGLSQMLADQATTAEEQRRWDAKESRLVQEDGRKQLARDASWGIKPVYALGDYGPTAKADRQRLLDIQTAEQAPTLAYLNATADSTDLATQEEAALAAFRQNLGTGRYTKSQTDELVRKRKHNLQEYRRTMGVEGADRQALQDQLVTDLYGNPLKTFDERIAKGVGLTKSQQEKALLRQVPEEYRQAVGRLDMQKLLADRLTGKTRDQLVTQEEKRVTDSRTRQKEEMDAYDKYIQRANAGRTSTAKYTKGGDWKGMATALENLSGLEIGYFDNADARQGFERLIEAGVRPEIASSAILYGVDHGLLGSSFPDVDTKEFARLQDLATSMQKTTTKDPKSGRTYVDPKKYKYRNVQTQTPEAILRKQLLGDIPLHGTVPVSNEFRQQYTDYSARNPITSAAQSTIWDQRSGNAPASKPSRSTLGAATPSGESWDLAMSAEQADVLGGLPEAAQIEMLNSMAPNPRGKVSQKGVLSRTYLEEAADMQQKREELNALYADHRTRFSKQYTEKKKAFDKAKKAHDETRANLRSELTTSNGDAAKIQDMQKELNALYDNHQTRYTKPYIELKKQLDKAKAAYEDRL